MKAADIARVVVIGAGTMGAGIAGLLARIGCNVHLVDQNDALLDRGIGLLRTMHDSLRTARTLTAKDAAASLRRIHCTTNLELACRGVQLAIEAVSEDLPLKQQVFRCVDAACPARAVLATNTSGLSVTAIAGVTRNPKRVAGMHFWNPPHLMPLVEIVKAEHTSDVTARLLLGLSRRLGKRPILVRRDLPGFVGNRLQFAVFREALHLLVSGVASAEDIDAAMTAGPGLRYGLLGPLRTADLGGLDVFAAISEYLFAHLCSQGHPPRHLADLVAKGRLGSKAGGGFYHYSPRDVKEILATRDRVLLGFLRVLNQDKG